jgi:hypothetical protein
MVKSQHFQRPDDPGRDLLSIRSLVKSLAPPDRAKILRWLCQHFDDCGKNYGIIRRRRVALGGKEYWVVRIPTWR